MSRPSAKAGIFSIRDPMDDCTEDDFPPAKILLNSNESAFGPGDKAISAAKLASEHLERYYEDPTGVLAPAIGHRFGLNSNKIAIGNGSDDLLARLFRAYVNSGDEVVRSVNGYAKAANYAYANNAVPVSAPDIEFRPNVKALLASVTDKTKVVYLANPENPAGTWLSGEEVRTLHGGLPEHVLLILDGAYEEYANAPDYESGHVLVDEFDNVVMTRTFSKAFGLAGARLGWLYAPESIIDVINRIGITFPLASPSVAAGLAALEDRDHVDFVIKETIRLRSELTGFLRDLGLTVYPSQANFVLIGFPVTGPSAKQAYLALREQGIVLRRFSAKAFANCVRLSIGLAPDTKVAAETLAHFVRSHG